MIFLTVCFRVCNLVFGLKGATKILNLGGIKMEKIFVINLVYTAKKLMILTQNIRDNICSLVLIINLRQEMMKFIALTQYLTIILLFKII